MKAAGGGFFHDERGSRSMARALLVIELVYLWVAGGLEAAGLLEGSGPFWALHGSLVIALVAWTAGPRMAQYLGPQVAGVASGIASSLRARLEGTDDHHKDDER